MAQGVLRNTKTRSQKSRRKQSLEEGQETLITSSTKTKMITNTKLTPNGK